MSNTEVLELDHPAAEPHVEAPAVPDVMALEKQYLLQNYARYPLHLERGKGCYLFDTNGKRYLDLISGIGVNALGHAHPRITRVIREQATKLIHCSNLYYHSYQGPLAKKLAEVSGLDRSFFANSGAEAMEGAIKMVRAHGNRTGAHKFHMVSLDNSFHGRTMGALSLTGQPKYRKDFEPLLTGVHFVPPNDVEALERVMNAGIAGVMIEGIQGEGGIYPISTEFLAAARRLCDQHDALLVVDDIQSGVGRPGAYFSYQLHNPVILPDIMVAAKPLACGLPLGVVVCNERAASAIAPGMHGTTFGGGALACRVALEFFEIMDELLPRVRQVGDYFRDRLRDLARKHEFVKEVRGSGLMIGVELAHPGKQLVIDGMAEGLLFNCTHDVVLRFLPPYILTEKEVDKAVRILRKLFTRFRPAA